MMRVKGLFQQTVSGCGIGGDCRCSLCLELGQESRGDLGKMGLGSDCPNGGNFILRRALPFVRRTPTKEWQEVSSSRLAEYETVASLEKSAQDAAAPEVGHKTVIYFGDSAHRRKDLKRTTTTGSFDQASRYSPSTDRSAREFDSGKANAKVIVAGTRRNSFERSNLAGSENSSAGSSVNSKGEKLSLESRRAQGDQETLLLSSISTAPRSPPTPPPLPGHCTTTEIRVEDATCKNNLPVTWDEVDQQSDNNCSQKVTVNSSGESREIVVNVSPSREDVLRIEEDESRIEDYWSLPGDTTGFKADWSFVQQWRLRGYYTQSSQLSYSSTPIF